MGNVKKIHIQDMQPVLMIAKYPRATIRFCLMFKPLLYFYFIGMVGAFSVELTKFIHTTYQPQFTLGDVVISSMVFGVIIFTITTVLMAGILQIVSKPIGGKGTFKQMFRALCLSYVPFIWILPILLFWMQLSPESYFVLIGKELTIGDKLMQYIGPAFVLFAVIWYLFLIFKAIQEVQRIKLSKSIAVFCLLVASMATISIAIYLASGIRII